MSESNSQAVEDQISDGSGPLLSSDDLANLSQLAGVEGADEEEEAEEATSATEAEGTTEESAETAEAAGEEAEGGEETAEAVEEDVDPEVRYAELQGKVDAGEPLTSEEKSELRGYEQSRADMEAARRQARELARANQQRLQEVRAKLPDSIISVFTAEAEAAREEGRNISPTLLKNALVNTLNGGLGEIKPLVEFEEDMQLRALILARLGDTSEAEQMTAEDVSHVQLISNALKVEYQRGLNEAKDSATIKKLRDELAEARAQLATMGADGAKKGSGPTQSKAKPVENRGGQLTGRDEDLAELRRREQAGELSFSV